MTKPISRETAHQQDTDSFQVLQEALHAHCQDQKITDAAVAKKIDMLMPLADLISPLQTIVKREEEQKAASKWMIRIGKGIGFLAIVVTSVATIFGAAWFIIEAVVKAKQ